MPLYDSDELLANRSGVNYRARPGLPVGTTGARPPDPQNGYCRFNLDRGTIEHYLNGTWAGYSTSEKVIQALFWQSPGEVAGDLPATSGLVSESLPLIYADVPGGFTGFIALGAVTFNCATNTQNAPVQLNPIATLSWNYGSGPTLTNGISYSSSGWGTAVNHFGCWNNTVAIGEVVNLDPTRPFNLCLSAHKNFGSGQIKAYQCSLLLLGYGQRPA